MDIIRLGLISKEFCEEKIVLGDTDWGIFGNIRLPIFFSWAISYVEICRKTKLIWSVKHFVDLGYSKFL